MSKGSASTDTRCGPSLSRASIERRVRAATVHFELCATEGGTRLVMDHYGVPDGFEEHVAGGWHARYWDPMRKFLAANS